MKVNFMYFWERLPLQKGFKKHKGSLRLRKWSFMRCSPYCGK
ncbi:hypothetical protein BVRB_6g149790 [Beta vulgaris subsp. vulgaris]|nr:hypothetical protein BVRB_6g149790 [Beta vulgaris subsp. vulgaris]